MKLLYIGLQGIRYNNTSSYIGELIIKWETCSLIHMISKKCWNHIQDLGLGKGCFHHWEHLIHNIENSSQTGFLQLLGQHLNHLTLTLCTSHIQAGCIADTAVRSNLHTIQMVNIINGFLIFRLRIRKFYRCIFLICFL